MDNVEIIRSLLRAELNNSKPDKNLYIGVSDDRWKEIFLLSARHDIAHIIGDVLLKNGILPDGTVKEEFEKQTFKALYRFNSQDIDFSSVCATLDKAGIDYIPLKGMVIRDYYPEKWLRTCGDVDILVKESDLEGIKELLPKETDFKFKTMRLHDLEGVSLHGVLFEFHYKLIEKDDMGSAYIPLENVWKNAEKVGVYRYKLNDLTFYYYHLAHTAKHFKFGGCGLRALIDTFLLSKNLKIDQDEKKKLLSLGGIECFSEKLEKLANVWFNGEVHDEITEKMQNYILDGGVYGTYIQKVSVSRVQKQKHYLLKRAFVPYSTLAVNYPVLKKAPFLLPFFEIVRLLKLFNLKTRKKAKREIMASKAVKKANLESINEIVKELNLK